MEELKKQRIWICWNTRNNTKVPIAADGRPTSSDTEKHGDTYVTYQEAIKAKQKRKYTGVGFVLPKGYFFLDIDHRDSDDELTKRLLDRFGCYAERSQSGNGIHIYGKCDPSQIPVENGKVSSRFYTKNPKLGIELYIGGLTKRFACYTGIRVNEEPLSDATQAVLVTFQHEMVKYKGKKQPVPLIHGDEEELFDMVCHCRKFKNGEKFKKLFDEGDWSDFGSHSEADLALCSMLAFRIGNDPALIDKAFRSSGLYRQKWEREDYRNNTIQHAIEGLEGHFYEPHFRSTDDEGLPCFVYIDSKGQLKVDPVGLVDEFNNTQYFLQVKSNGKETVQTYIYKNGCYHLYDDRMIKGVLKQIIQEYNPGLVNTRAINEAYAQLMMETVFVPYEELDADDTFINFQNGLLYLPTLELRPHDPKIYSTVQLPCDWSGQELKTPCFDQYMEDLFPGDMAVQQLVMQFLGIAISNVPGYLMKKAMFIYGDGDTGKSQILEFAKSLVGKEYCSSIDLKALEDKFGTSQLFGKRICGTAEMKYAVIDELNIFKSATGGDEIGIEFKRENMFSFKFKGVLWFCGNRLPRFGGDNGTWVYDRMIALHCTHIIPPEKRDKKLQEKFKQEREGVVYKAVLAAKQVIENNYQYDEPASVVQVREVYRCENNNVLSFLSECCLKTTDTSLMDGWCTTSGLYKIYCQWCNDNGRKSKSSSEFRKEVALEFHKPHAEISVHKKKGSFYTCLSLNTETASLYRHLLDPNFAASREFEEDEEPEITLDDPDLPF